MKIQSRASQLTLLLLIVLLGTACGITATAPVKPAAAPAPAAPAIAPTTAAESEFSVEEMTFPPLAEEAGDDGLPTIPVGELPPEALETINLIVQGGPFPYRQDDGVFQNREGFLPDQPRGFYHEYTVETPGSSDRGARRIVTGEDGQVYYTDDHYASFKRVVK